MSRRDSDSKRRHSKFDREPSPKRYRRDGKQERERERDRVTTNGGGGDHNHMDRDQRNLPVSHHSKQEPSDAAHKKSNSNDHYEPPKHSSQQPRSRSFYQDEQGTTGQVGRSTGRREASGKASTQIKENNQRVETSQSGEQRGENSEAKLDDNFQRRDGFSERKDVPPSTMRKRPAFREKKIPADSGDANPAATVSVKSSHTDHPPEKNERKEERSSNPRHLDRPEKQNADNRVPNKSEARRDGFSSRVRYGNGGGNSNYRGRDNFNGRQGYNPVKTQTEKWKHDLYQEVNKDPTPKSEDDQIAKLEALLAS
ncbi:uncharacterized protein LOC133316167 isoform X2 [Gastrolobium bilobum]|uniref:uncharacterized protein LOC133316167 isoform X2 n=1 Tax=Gastrolobium bilobum TaxID=150636 RepID=UPI002AB0E908|nr:uncharacterized protein LOC133316167 isoform X2 [Gastrolobium bilobum]